MPLDDRHYMRAAPARPLRASWLPSTMTVRLVVVLAIFFILYQVSLHFLHTYALHDWLALSYGNLIGMKVWTVLTYTLLHDSLLHLACNCLGLFFIGRILEDYIGPRRLLQIFLLFAVAGGLLWFAVNWRTPSPLIGASAATLGLLIFYCCLEPDRPMTLLLFFILPVTLKPRYIAYCAVFIDTSLLLFSELQGKTHVAHSAHLGGMAMAFLTYRIGLKARARASQTSWFKPKSSPKITPTKFTLNMASRSEMEREVNRILDKINAHGFGALTPEERATLDRARDLLRRPE